MQRGKEMSNVPASGKGFKSKNSAFYENNGSQVKPFESLVNLPRSMQCSTQSCQTVFCLALKYTAVELEEDQSKIGTKNGQK